MVLNLHYLNSYNTLKAIQYILNTILKVPNLKFYENLFKYYF